MLAKVCYICHIIYMKCSNYMLYNIVAGNYMKNLKVVPKQ